jgi:hypothetical protein
MAVLSAENVENAAKESGADMPPLQVNEHGWEVNPITPIQQHHGGEQREAFNIENECLLHRSSMAFPK